ncbi:MAG: valine--tRNA ligase [Campylobacterales bacterium]|nr:valine--tRNA ligase [Campylobacterales bacterium]
MSSKTTFEPKAIEAAYYPIWEERGYFELDANADIQKEGAHFAIMLPPPNVTGSLHIGHALNHTLIDIITRYKRMDGYKTLWQPGTDHAGIATQNVVEKQLLAEGSSKEALGREAFLERVWKWKAHSGGTIVGQMRRLGVSPAWSRERFTMDEGLKNSVREAFVHLYNEGIIVRGNYMVNWCTHDGALSDIEVEYEEKQGALYHIRYPLTQGGHIVVATTRPETYFGDTAVMVHPEDERYTHLIGQSVRLPLTEREIPVIANAHVDMSFGTGVVKVTPAHDPNDYEVGKRHDLEFITVFDESGILNDYAGSFKGLERLEARGKIVAALEAAGFMEKIEPHTHQVGTCYRCRNIVEPYISRQWFVRSEVAKKSIQKTNEGAAQFFPSHWINSYNAWMGDLRDWCISRQLWWGHRIPVFYCDDCGHEWASRDEHPAACPKCASHAFTQDPDVLDTWFSSALWPFSTLGWGNEGASNAHYGAEDMRTFYPNSLMITGFDILFFWVARMMMMGEHLIGELPFKDIYLHALVRDEHGQKMSKSRGNVIDPLEMIEEYSADALRFTLASLAAQGRDIRLSRDKLEQSRNFTNKLFNASKFLLMNASEFPDLGGFCVETPLGKFMLSRLNVATQNVREAIESYRFNDAATLLYRFLWSEFCDWGIELSKASKESIIELGAIFKEAMKLLHPFMPFISECLYHELSNTALEEGAGSIMILPYPHKTKRRDKEERLFEVIQDAIVSIRRAKTLIDLGNQKIALAFVKAEGIDEALAKAFIERLAKVEEVRFTCNKVENAISDIGEHVEVYLPTESIDLSPIIARLSKQLEKSEKEAQKLENMLSNERFVANAQPQVIEKSRAKLADAQSKIAAIQEQLKALGA